MITIKNVKIGKVGSSRGIIIPSDYFKHERLKEGKNYHMVLTEAKDES